MTDITTELRERSLRAEQEGEPLALLDDAADEIIRLRDALDEQTGRAEWNYECVTACEEKVIQRDAEIARLREAIRRLAEQDATLSVQGGVVTVTADATLTDAEREAVEYVVGQRRERESWVHATLRGLLSRTGDCPTPDNAADRDNGTADSE